MTVYIISGSPGVGKSTVSQQLASSFEKAIHTNCDGIYNMVKGGYKAPWNDPDKTLHNAMCDAAASIVDIYSQIGFSCVVDYVFFVEELLNLIPKIKTKNQFSVIYLMPSLEVNIQRDKNFGRDYVMGRERIEIYHKDFLQLTKKVKSFTIDNTNLSVDETVALIKSRPSYSRDEIMALLRNPSS